MVSLLYCFSREANPYQRIGRAVTFASAKVGKAERPWGSQGECLPLNISVSPLFLSAVNLDRTACEFEIVSQLIFEESLVWIADILRKIAEECKSRELCRQLGDVLHLHILALPRRWRGHLYDREEYLVELVCAYLA